MSAGFLTPAEVADKLALSKGAVTRALRENRIPGYKVLGVWRVSCAELEDWIESQRVPSRQSEPSSRGFIDEVRQKRESRNGNEVRSTA